MLLWFIVLVPLIFVLLKRARDKGRNNYRLPPGPRGLPIIGSFHLLGSQPHLTLHRLALKYGPIFHFVLGEVPTVIVSSAKLAKEVLKTYDIPLASRPRLFAAKKLFYDCTDMVFAPYGAYWRQVRKICILELLSAKRVDSFVPGRAAEVDKMISRIVPGDVVNLSKVLGKYANGVVCRAAFGREFVEDGEYDKLGFQKLLEEYQVLLGGFSIWDFIPSWEWLSLFTGMKWRLESTFHGFDQLFDQIIAEHNKKRTKRKNNDSNEEVIDLVDVLLDVQAKGGLEMPLTMENVKAIILDMFAAGTDTTFITLDWAMTELIMNPQVMKKAQDEVRRIVGSRKKVIESDIHQMPYLKAVIKEVFRLHPPAPVLVPREAMERVQIDNCDIPAKTRIFVNAWAIGRDPALWQNPDSFRPERFLDSLIDFKGQDFELIPFGAGRRSCPAITLGVAGVEIALAQLLYSFDWELPEGTKPEDLDMTEVFGITMHRRQELLVVPTAYNFR